MADLEIGKDSNLTTTLLATDRITITRAATGQKVATMTVANFMERCAAMMPTATTSANGTLSNTLFKVFEYFLGALTLEQYENEPITDSSCRFKIFRNTTVFSKITPSRANWFFGFALRAAGSETERQFLFDYNGNIYTRYYDGTEWDEMKSFSSINITASSANILTDVFEYNDLFTPPPRNPLYKRLSGRFEQKYCFNTS